LGLLGTRHGKDSFWVAISYVGDGPQEMPAQWVISVNADSGFNIVKRLFHKPDRSALQRLRTCVREAIMSNPRMKVVGTPNYS
jgi:hypothetical protein